MPYLAKENALSVDDVCSVEFMARFGRMLWWTRWKHGDSLVRQGLISFAVEKLNCNHPKVLTENGQLSALNVRLLLDFAPRRQIAVDKQIELVAGHMLIVHCIPDFLEGMRTSAPSEPILAEAAARIMTNMSHIPQYLLKQVGDGLVSSDDGGNLVARLLLTLAHDQAVQAYQAAKASRAPSAYSPVVRPLYTEAILLVDFLKALISDNWLKLILDSYPTNIAPSDALRKPFREMFKDALINFTHFVRTGDGSLVRDEGAWLAFVRGMGVQWSYNKPTVNIFLPLLLRDEKIGRHVMSGLFIQVENGRHSEPECAHVDAETLNFFSMNPSGQADNRPYVCITMNLGPRSTEKLGPNGQQRPPNVRTDESCNSSHPRYAFTIFGCSSSVYEVIMPNEKNIYAYLRVPQSLMGEYPYREDVDRNAAMLRMKPVWVAGTSSYEWSGAEPDAGPSGLEAQSEQTVGFEGVEVEVWDGLEG
ncbi:hypothetical protein EW026_g3752 [Hermanssonia centrifuga]|uniref:Uncharacterized protein n=1 Tax=Hermanssonia centrifuga TaxID=98765 RepID=A0A4V3XAJ5_9APHY|nr:hypothetical protein EW026_g3752 [Hermanssonia centrifuga]